MKAALFAAIDGMQPKNQSKGGFLSVWALSLVKLDMIPTKDKPFAVVTVPSASNSNLRAQEGLFTLAQPVKTGAEDFERKSFDEQLTHWIDERKVVLETLTGIVRAGADLIITYHARDIAKWLSD